MSIHNTLANKGSLARHRNVLSREERLRKLEAEGSWDESQGIFGIPKVRNIKVQTGGQKKKKEEEAASTADSEGTTAP